MKYKQIAVATTSEFSDIISVILCENGSEGASVSDKEELNNALKDFSWDYLDENFFSSLSDICLVSGFFDLEFDQNIILKELENLRQASLINTGSLEMFVEIIDSQNWENVWKKYYKPIKIKNISVVPSWLKNRHKNTVPVYINPGMAFGTGSHETTLMCIELMQGIEIENKTVSDVGCGSGILGICALKLGAASCDFYDTDPNAVKATSQNLEFNKTAGVYEIFEGSVKKADGKRADIILANLTADILIMLYETFVSMQNSGSKLIISGIIQKRLKEVEKVFYKDYKVVKMRSKNDWRALILEKK